MAETVEFESDGATASGYLVTPSGGSGPGVVVVQEWWGLDPALEEGPRIIDRSRSDYLEMLARYAQQLGVRALEVLLQGSGTPADLAAGGGVGSPLPPRLGRDGAG